MEFVIQVVTWAGPLGLFAGFIWFMCAKKGWEWSTVIASVIFALLLASAAPNLPQATHDGLEGFVTALVDSQ